MKKKPTRMKKLLGQEKSKDVWEQFAHLIMTAPKLHEPGAPKKPKGKR